MRFSYLEKDFPVGSLFLLFILALQGCDSQSSGGVQLEAGTSVQGVTLLTTDTLPAKDTLATPASSPTVTVIGVGDMMLGTNFPASSYLPPNGGADLIAPLYDTIRAADIAFGNLEGVLLDKGGTAKRCSNPNACYAFRSPESYGRHFRDAGFDFLSLANNHTADFGPAGRTRTKAVLDEMGIHYAGLAGTDETAVLVKDSIRYGFCAFAPNTGTCDIRNIPVMERIVRDLAGRSDIVIVSFHGGAEGAKHQHVPRRTETYYGENRGDVYRFAHAAIDAGADVVFGHGPHVTRGAELYQERFIIYSLGNFCTYARFNLRGPAGVAPMVRLELDKDGKFSGGQVISTYQTKTQGPRVDDQQRALTYLRNLSQADFPESPLRFSKTGRMYLEE